MSTGPYRVRVVVDKSFGDRLLHLPPNQPVWVVDSPANTPVAKRLWSERPSGNQLTGVTVFRAGAALGEPLLLGILGQVDLYHGGFSTDLPCSEIEVYGISPSGAIEKASRELGFGNLRPTPDGFIAMRTLN